VLLWVRYWHWCSPFWLDFMHLNTTFGCFR